MSAFGRRNGAGGGGAAGRPAFGVAKPMKSGAPQPGQRPGSGGDQFPPLPGELDAAPPPPTGGGANRADAMSRLADRATAAASDGNSEVAGFEASVAHRRRF